MRKHKVKRALSLLIVLAMMLSVLSVNAFASEETGGKEAVSDWQTFLSDLKILENYADSYAAANTGEDVVKLVINYVRTGVDRYQTDSWVTIAGEENTAFVTYVEEQDAANGTAAGALRNLEDIVLPNGNTMDFGHLFGCLNVSSNNSYNQNYTDFGSWVGDICDLMECSDHYGVEATDIEDLVSEITEKYFLDNYLTCEGFDGSTSGFSEVDLRADLDCFYIVSRITEGATTLSEIFEGYYTDSLKDADRAVNFLNNRFNGSATQEKVRASIKDTYTNHVLVQMLEADRGLSDANDLRTACCYVLADYLFKLADGSLKEPENPEEPDNPGEEDEPSVYSVFSSAMTDLAPGVTQTINYALNSKNEQIAYCYATVDVSRDDVSIYANYHNNDPSTGWAMSSVSSQMTAAEKRHSDPSNEDLYIENYSAVVGINASGYNMSTGQPGGLLVMEGVTYNGHNGSSPFFAILENGTAIIGTAGEYETYENQIVEAVQGFGSDAMLVVKGENKHSSSETSLAPRTAVGLTADGQVIMIAVDGRQAPYSCGVTYYELAEIMIDAGCVTAMALDGGGSTTFDAKQEGSDDITVVNRPCDGYERNVSSSLMVVSTAYTSTEFDHALLTTDTDYLTVNSSLDVTVTGVSSTGNAAEVPEGAYLQVSDSSIGMVKGNTFTALARGTVDIQLVADGEVVGSKTVTVIKRPDTLKFTKSSINATYGEAAELPLAATYENNPVTINTDDITFTFSTSAAGAMDGFSFVGDETSGVRKVTITAAVATDPVIQAQMMVCLYSSDESAFDFEKAMYGDVSLAWNREVSNTTTLDNTTYYITDKDKDTTGEYTFAMDIQAIQAPERLAPLMEYLAGFAGTSGDATPWDYMLALAARVNTHTNVTITVEIDEGVDVDISNLNVVNDYFKLTSAEFDEETRVLTVICNWVKQDGAIDPDTANSICVLSGISLTPSDDAGVDTNNCVRVGMTGSVSYDIYLRSSQLYSLANDANTQEAYGVYPYYDPDDSAGNYGGHFSDKYITFEDNYKVCQEALNGWVSMEDQLYYYIDNQYVTGIQCIPGYDDSKNKYYYRFDENGVCVSKVTGLFEINGDLYYAINGEGLTGWRMITADGADNYYFFDPDTGKAVDGEQTIYGYDYVFTDHVLTRGDLVKSDEGIHYKWAGEWVRNSWIEIDGKKYYASKTRYGYFITNLHTQIHKYGSDSELGYCLFDEDGVWQEDYSGLYTDESDNTYLIEKGYLVEGAGLVYLDGDYYYFRTSTSTAVKGRSYWITVTNDLLPSGQYTFADDGKMVNPPATDPDPIDPDPTEPDPDPTEPKVKNGIVAENGSLYYYVNDTLTGAGLIKIDNDYYYVRTSNGEVVHGRTYWVTATNDLLSSGQYMFADDGKMIDPPVTDPDPTEPDPDPVEPDPEVKNGIVAENGSLYYYVDGVLTGAGLIRIDSDYYYVRTSSGEVVHGRTYWVTATNGLLPSMQYTFADDGKMVQN